MSFCLRQRVFCPEQRVLKTNVHPLSGGKAQFLVRKRLLGVEVGFSSAESGRASREWAFGGESGFFDN